MLVFILLLRINNAECWCSWVLDFIGFIRNTRQACKIREPALRITRSEWRRLASYSINLFSFFSWCVLWLYYVPCTYHFFITWCYIILYMYVLVVWEWKTQWSNRSVKLMQNGGAKHLLGLTFSNESKSAAMPIGGTLFVCEGTYTHIVSVLFTLSKRDVPEPCKMNICYGK